MLFVCDINASIVYIDNEQFCLTFFSILNYVHFLQQNKNLNKKSNNDRVDTKKQCFFSYSGTKTIHQQQQQRRGQKSYENKLFPVSVFVLFRNKFQLYLVTSYRYFIILEKKNFFLFLFIIIVNLFKSMFFFFSLKQSLTFVIDIH